MRCATSSPMCGDPEASHRMREPAVPLAEVAGHSRSMLSRVADTGSERAR